MSEEQYLKSITFPGIGKYLIGSSGSSINIDETLSISGDAADAQVTGEQLQYRSQGLYANDYRISGPGWKRLAVLIRGNSGQIDINLSRIDQVYGRHSQNIILGYSGFVDFPSMKWLTTLDRKSNRLAQKEKNSKPYIWQIVNHYDGENLDTCSQEHLMFIDKVRLAYPINWDNIDTSNMSEEEAYEYQNPINIYLDVHITTGQNLDWTKKARGVLEFNIAGHTWNHRAMAFTEEKDCIVDAEGYVLGEFNNVKCQTYEFQLYHESAMQIQDLVKLDQLCTNQSFIAKQIVLNTQQETNDLRYLGDNIKYNRVKNIIPLDKSYEYIVQPYRKNLVVPMDSEDIANINGSEVGFIRKANGIYQTSGVASKDTFTLITRQIPKTHSMANAAPIILKAGKTYYIKDCILVTLPESEFRNRIDNNGSFKWTDTRYGTMDRTDCATITVPADENIVVEAIALQFQYNVDYTKQEFYPQICEKFEDLIWSNDLYDSTSDIWYMGYDDTSLPEKMYSPRGTIRTGDNSHLPLGADYALHFDMWSFEYPDFSGEIILDTMVPRYFYSEIEVDYTKFNQVNEYTWSQDIAIQGLLASDNPNVKIKNSIDNEFGKNLFNLIEDIITYDGGITIIIKSYDNPTLHPEMYGNFTLILKENR